MIKNKQYHIMLASGGTGGHIFPAEALAEELTARGHKVSLVTDSRFSDYSESGAKGIFGEIPIYHINAGTLGSNIFKRIKGALNIVIGIFQARRIIKRHKPDAIVGFGGYPSFPTMIAATSTDIPTIIHEQNAILGKANRVIASKVTRIATSFENTGLMQDENKHKIILVGNPVRSAIRALHNIPYPDLSQDGMMRLLVTGGSQGANIFAEIVPKAIALLPENLRQRLRVDQQTRAEDMDKTRKLYNEINVQADLSPFFSDIPARLASTHLVICRSGASTVAELTCSGRPGIYVPYPSATDDHQTANAVAIDNAGGGWVMPQDSFTTETLSARLESFLALPASLSRAAENTHEAGQADAAKKLADTVINDIESPNSNIGETTNKPTDNISNNEEPVIKIEFAA